MEDRENICRNKISFDGESLKAKSNLLLDRRYIDDAMNVWDLHGTLHLQSTVVNYSCAVWHSFHTRLFSCPTRQEF